MRCLPDAAIAARGLSPLIESLARPEIDASQLAASMRLETTPARGFETETSVAIVSMAPI
jgi:hypothetical protein